MNTVVMIAYAFPPEGIAGVYRPLRFIRHLSRVGWKAKVISAVPSRYTRYDPALISSVPPDTEIVRVRVRDPWQTFQSWRQRATQRKFLGAPEETAQKIHKAQRRPFRSQWRERIRIMEAWCYHPDMAMSWIRPAVKATLKLCASNQPNVIWATAGPVSSFLVAERVSQNIGVPYVLDFRDAWTLTGNAFEDRRPGWARLAPWSLSDCDRHLCVFPVQCSGQFLFSLFAPES